MTEHDTKIDALLAHAPFLRRLARGLVGDEARAADLVQETWLSALRRPPQDPGGARPWLAAVARRLSIDARKADARRAERERRGARDEALPASADVEAHVELAHVLLDVVRSLSDPYREAIWLRYYEELPPRAIALRLGVPVKTVDTRLRRGKDELRARLDKGSGGREAWLPGMAGLAGLRETGTVSVASGTSAAILGVSLLAVSLVVVGLLMSRTKDAAAGEPQVLMADAQPTAAPVQVALSKPPARAPESGAPERTPAIAAESARAMLPISSQVADEATGTVLEGSVRWADFEPEGPVQLGLIRTVGGVPSGRFLAHATCDAGAPFELEVPEGGAMLLVAVAEGAPVSTSPIKLLAGERTRLDVLENEPGLTLAGVIRDAEGAPLGGARLTANLRGTSSGAWLTGAVLGPGTSIQFNSGERDPQAARVPTFRLRTCALRYQDGAFRLTKEQSVCDAQGRFRFVGLGGGEHTIDAVRPWEEDDAGSTRLSLPRETAPLIALAPAEHAELSWNEAVLRFEVRDAAGPVKWATAQYGPYQAFEQAEEPARQRKQRLDSITLGESSRLTLRYDPADDLALRFDRDGFAPVLVRLASAVPDERGIVEVTLPRTAPPADLRLRLDCPGQAPPERVLISLDRQTPTGGGGRLHRELALIGGEATIRDVLPGSYLITLLPRDAKPFMDLKRVMDLEPGVTTLQATLELGSAIELESDAPEDSRISLMARDSSGRHVNLSGRAAAGPEGTRTRLFPALAPGTWTLVPRQGAAEFPELELSLTTGQVARVSLAMPR